MSKVHKYPDLMVDIETLGTNSNAPIIQIGACVFDIMAGKVGPSFAVLVKADLQKSKPDLSTVSWWMQQNEEARMHVSDCHDHGAIEEDAILDFKGWVLANTQGGVDVWAMPPEFDIVILKSLFSRFGYSLPWSYNATRCLRTLERLAGGSYEDRVKPLVAHDAGSDAEAQAHTAIKYYSKIIARRQ